MKTDPKDMVEVFELFLKEVSLTYGEGISAICKKKLALLDDIDKVDEIKILDEAKKEAGFDPEKSSLYYAGINIG